MRAGDADFVVESIPNLVHGAPTHRKPRVYLAPIAPLIVGATATAICYAAAGVSLGLFLGGVFWAAALTGPLTSAERGWLGRSLAALGLIHGIAGIWFFAGARADFPVNQILFCYAALASFVFALTALAALLEALRLAPIVAGAAATLFALAWIFWPVWASPVLTGERGETAVNWLVPANPIFAVNAVVREKLGYWVEQSIAYHYTNLSDDVSYSLPRTVWPCVFLHSGIAVVCGLFTRLVGRRRADSPAA